MDLWIIIGVWVACGLASMLVGRSRGLRHVASWFVMGTLLGPFGLILALMDARPPRPEYTMEALNRLREMRTDGVLSEEEYAARRSELLGRL